VYKAWGSYIEDPVYRFARDENEEQINFYKRFAVETNNKKLGLNHHVSYIHSKFLLFDPLGNDPIVVTGSANFSDNSTTANDENMLIIRGDKRVADIYFTEFNRLFNHYYFRAVAESTARAGVRPDHASAFLTEKFEWLKKYKEGTLRSKRVNLIVGMKGFVDS
jgi:phosphatidylserine/phosphatidylglycerophosphate/cardiolipin synthase-like enzyme